MEDKKKREKKESNMGIIKGKDSKQTKLKIEKGKRVKFSQEDQEGKFKQEIRSQMRIEVRREIKNLSKV